MVNHRTPIRDRGEKDNPPKGHGLQDMNTPHPRKPPEPIRTVGRWPLESEETVGRYHPRERFNRTSFALGLGSYKSSFSGLYAKARGTTPRNTHLLDKPASKHIEREEVRSESPKLSQPGLAPRLTTRMGRDTQR